MSKPLRRLPVALLCECRRQHVRPTRDLLVVSVAAQRVVWFQRAPLGDPFAAGGYRVCRVFRASTSKFGPGQVRDTNRTPLGLHRVARKIGGGWPVGAVFRARQFTGFTWAGQPGATIAHRILWLEGLETGFNRGGIVDTFARYIYIHGLADEATLGRPASHGCIHLAAADLLPLYDRVAAGTVVWIGG